MTTVNLAKPASEEMQNWQLTMLYAQLQLLGDHAGDYERCVCEKKDETGEFCVAKHLTAIAEGYCTETIPMTGDDSLKQVLSQIRNGATDLRREYLKAMSEGKEPAYDDIVEFARDARKELEPYLWRYKTHQPASDYITLHQAEPRWCYGVKSVDTQLGRFAPALFSNICTGGKCYNGGEVKMADPILAEITRQICSTGICLAEPKKRSKLPICTASEKKKLESCILAVKAKLPAKCEPYWSKPANKQPEDCVNPWAVCRASLGCRLGSRKEKA